jgi:WD40 repeat protein
MQLANESVTDVPLPPTTFHPSGVAQAVNVLWFSSLILSLFAALFGIFVKQWLNTYSNWNDIADPQRAVLVRGMYSRGLKVWHVPNILATLPLLLQLALLFFVAGLVTYLWTVDHVVAGFLSVLVVAGLIVAVVAIVLPVFFEGCSYKSPLGLLLVRVLKSSFSSWRERDLDMLERELPDDEEKHMQAYHEAGALLDIAPGADGLLSNKELIATRVNDLKVHADTLLFKLLRTILFAFADGPPSNNNPEILQSMVHVLNAASAGNEPMETSVIQGFVKHVTETRHWVPGSPDAIEEQLSSIHALASCIARHRTSFNVSGLAESAVQLRSWLQQWVAMSLDSAGGNVEYKKNWPTLDGLLQQRSILSHPTTVNCVAFSRDGSEIVLASEDNIVRVWDSSTGKVVQELKGHTTSVLSVAFSPNGTRIVSSSLDGTVRVWDPDSGAELRTLRGHTHMVMSVAFSPNGTRIVSGSHDQTVRVWDSASGAELRKLRGHTSWVMSVAFSPNGTRIVSGSEDRTVRVWNSASGVELQRLWGHTSWVMSVAFSPNGTRIVSGSSDQTVRVWDADSGKKLRTLEGHTDPVHSIAFSPNGTRIVSGSHDRTVRVWDAESGAELRMLEGHTASVDSVAFSPNGARIVSGSKDQTVRIWDADSGADLRTLEGHTDPVHSIAFSPNGTRIVSGLANYTVRVSDADSGAELRKLKGHTAPVESVAFSPNGARIVSGSEDRTVRVWDADSGAELRTLRGHTHLVMSVAFSPNGTRIVSGSEDRTVRVWDADSGVELQRLWGHTDWVRSVAFSPSGARIVSGSGDQTVRIWDANSGAELQTFNGVAAGVASVAFSLDGTSITCKTIFGASHTWTAPHDFALPTNPPLLPLAPPSPIFTLDSDSGWILGQNDPQSPSRRLFWVAPERRGRFLSHGCRVLLLTHDINRAILTLLDFKGVM